MAYETDAYSDPTDLLNKFAVFIEANGWTRDSLVTEGSGRRYHAHRGSQYVNMRALVNETAPSSSLLADGGTTNIYGVSFNIGTGYSGASAWYAQAGVPSNNGGKKRSVGIQNLSAAGTYHFFAHDSGDRIVVVVEYSSGLYDRFYFGLLEKFGTWTGGDYFGGSRTGLKTIAGESGIPFGFFQGNHNGLEQLSGMGNVLALINVDVDAESGWHWNSAASFGASRRMIRDTYNIYAFAANGANQPNTTNSLAVFLPVVAFVDRTATSTINSTTVNSPIGYIPEIAYCSLAALVPGQQVVLGSTAYRVFPLFKKNSIKAIPSVGSQHSGWYGFAVAE